MDKYRILKVNDEYYVQKYFGFWYGKTWAYLAPCEAWKRNKKDGIDWKSEVLADYVLKQTVRKEHPTIQIVAEYAVPKKS